MSRRYKKFEIWMWQALPGLITLALLIVYLIPKHISGFGQVMPLFPLMAVFFWGLTQRETMPYWLVFLLGLVMDTATGLPLGLSSLLYVLFLAMLHAQRRYIRKEGFIIKWGFFALSLAALMALNWLLLWIFFAQFASIRPAVVQWLLSSCIYPFFHMGFGLLAEHMAARRWKLEHIR